MTTKLERLSNLLVDDVDFCQKVIHDIESIKKDGKIDTSDVPHMINIIIICINERDNIELTPDEVPEFITLVVRLLLHKFNVIEENEYEQIDKIVETCIELAIVHVVTNEQVHNGIKVALAKCFPCFNKN